MPHYLVYSTLTLCYIVYISSYPINTINKKKGKKFLNDSPNPHDKRTKGGVGVLTYAIQLSIYILQFEELSKLLLSTICTLVPVCSWRGFESLLVMGVISYHYQSASLLLEFHLGGEMKM